MDEPFVGGSFRIGKRKLEDEQDDNSMDYRSDRDGIHPRSYQQIWLKKQDPQRNQQFGNSKMDYDPTPQYKLPETITIEKERVIKKSLFELSLKNSITKAKQQQPYSIDTFAAKVEADKQRPQLEKKLQDYKNEQFQLKMSEVPVGYKGPISQAQLPTYSKEHTEDTKQNRIPKYETFPLPDYSKFSEGNRKLKAPQPSQQEVNHEKLKVKNPISKEVVSLPTKTAVSNSNRNSVVFNNIQNTNALQIPPRFTKDTDLELAIENAPPSFVFKKLNEKLPENVKITANTPVLNYIDEMGNLLNKIQIKKVNQQLVKKPELSKENMQNDVKQQFHQISPSKTQNKQMVISQKTGSVDTKGVIVENSEDVKIRPNFKPLIAEPKQPKSVTFPAFASAKIFQNAELPTYSKLASKNPEPDLEKPLLSLYEQQQSGLVINNNPFFNSKESMTEKEFKQVNTNISVQTFSSIEVGAYTKQDKNEGIKDKPEFSNSINPNITFTSIDTSLHLDKGYAKTIEPERINHIQPTIEYFGNPFTVSNNQTLNEKVEMQPFLKLGNLNETKNFPKLQPTPKESAISSQHLRNQFDHKASLEQSRNKNKNASILIPNQINTKALPKEKHVLPIYHPKEDIELTLK